jgi:hypothetical protein
LSPDLSLPAPSSNARSSVTPISRLRDLAIRGLARMYRPNEGLFAFRIRRNGEELLLEGSSHRYTAIALIGLAGEDEMVQTAVLAGIGVREACARLVSEVPRIENLGDVALILWAGSAAGYPDRRLVVEQLLSLRPDEAVHSTVEVAWTLAALCADFDAPVGPLRYRLARRLIVGFESRSGLFPHYLGGGPGLFRGHVCCFADLVYPIHALARYAELFGDTEARDVALRCAQEFCARQGPDGQWWWHYDRRTGDVVEHYPVYAVHQDAMAPMALWALERATAIDLSSPIARGLGWLAHAPELGGGSLIDEGADLIWRKVARREPRKLSRYAQAAASRLHSAFRAPGLDILFPPCVVDYEDRPYHLGWLLHAWPAGRAIRWDGRAIPQ